MYRALNCRFNSDCSCIIATYQSGFKVISTIPFKLLLSTLPNSSSNASSRPENPSANPTLKHLYLATILNSTNIILLVHKPQTKLTLYDDISKTSSSMTFDLPVVNAFINKHAILAVFSSFICITSLKAPHPVIARIETSKNEEGVACMLENTIVVPSTETGAIHIIEFNESGIVNQQELTIHKSAIVTMAMNEDYIASCSHTGTLIRCVNRKTLELSTFRRGVDQTRIWAIALSKKNRMAVLSSNGTLHVYDLERANGAARRGSNNSTIESISDTDMGETIPSSPPNATQTNETSPVVGSPTKAAKAEDAPSGSKMRAAGNKMTAPLRRKYQRDGKHIMHTKTLSKSNAVVAWTSETELMVARAADNLCETFFINDEAISNGPYYPL